MSALAYQSESVAERRLGKERREAGGDMHLMHQVDVLSCHFFPGEF